MGKMNGVEEKDGGQNEVTMDSLGKYGCYKNTFFFFFK